MLTEDFQVITTDNEQYSGQTNDVFNSTNTTVTDIVNYDAFLMTFIHKKVMMDLIHIGLYQADFSSYSSNSNNKDLVIYIQKFLQGIYRDVQTSTTLKVATKSTLATITLVKQILEIKSDLSAKLINYDSALQHFNASNISAISLLEEVKANRLVSLTEFKNKLDEILRLIRVYNEIQVVRPMFVSLDILKDDAVHGQISPLNHIRSVKDVISEAYNEFANLKSVNNDSELTDYLMFLDSDSTVTAAEHITDFLSNSYKFFKTGYDVIDDSIGGIESSTVTIITGPSNHAKSIFMINIARKMIIENPDNLTDSDALVFITLEDDIYKLLRRIMGIFGQAEQSMLKQLFVKASELLNDSSASDITKQQNKVQLNGVLVELLEASVISITKGNCRFIIKHCNENSFSMTDATAFISKLSMEGITTKSLFIDYIDVMVPSATTYNGDEYSSHGQIVQEMRQTSRSLFIPIITITQNSKVAENMSQAMSNALIGDSYKKVRYADTIIMIRQRHDLDLLSEEVKKDIVSEGGSLAMHNMTDDYYNLIPFEAKITKAKEGQRDTSKFHIFNPVSLNIYNNLEEYEADKVKIDTMRTKINESISLLGIKNNITIEFDSSNTGLANYNSDFNNLII